MTGRSAVGVAMPLFHTRHSQVGDNAADERIINDINADLPSLVQVAGSSLLFYYNVAVVY